MTSRADLLEMVCGEGDTSTDKEPLKTLPLKCALPKAARGQLWLIFWFDVHSITLSHPCNDVMLSMLCALNGGVSCFGQPNRIMSWRASDRHH